MFFTIQSNVSLIIINLINLESIINIVIMTKLLHYYKINLCDNYFDNKDIKNVNVPISSL